MHNNTAKNQILLRQEVQHILDYGINATVFYNEKYTEALIHTDSTIISVTVDGDTSETPVSYSTGYEV